MKSNLIATLWPAVAVFATPFQPSVEILTLLTWPATVGFPAYVTKRLRALTPVKELSSVKIAISLAVSNDLTVESLSVS